MSQWGGPRQGQPGKSYGNRTDLQVDRAPTVAGPPTPDPVGPAQAAMTTTPDDTPFLSAPGNPDVPMTAGLPTGPGPGAPNVARDDMEIIKRYMPDLKAAAAADGAPLTFKALVRYLEGA